METKRRVARAVAVVAVALAAGHLVQNATSDNGSGRARPGNIIPVAAGPGETGSAPAAPVAAPVVPPTVASAKEPSAPAVDGAVVAEGTDTDIATTASCDIMMDLSGEGNGTMTLVLTAPCNPDQRIVLSHEGLAVTARTSLTGSVFAQLPALAVRAEVTAKFPDGRQVSASTEVPEAATLRRFGVQWQGRDGFGIHALENDAAFGSAGDVSGANPHTPVTGIPAKGGHLTLLGDSTVDLPLLAEVYTFPTDPATRADVLVEAAVTARTCGSDLLGETLNQFGGSTYITDLTLAMPDCDGVGDYLVLKNLVLDPKLAARD